MLNTKRKRAPGELPRRSSKEKYLSNGISNPKFTVEVWDEHFHSNDGDDCCILRFQYKVEAIARGEASGDFSITWPL